MRPWSSTPARRIPARRERLRRSSGPSVRFRLARRFCRGRDAALARATVDYAWLDADDVTDLQEREKLRVLFGSLRIADAPAPDGPHSGPYGPGDRGGPYSGPYGHVLRCSCDPGPNGNGGPMVVCSPRSWRGNRRWFTIPALRRWTGPRRPLRDAWPRHCAPRERTR